MKAVQTQMAEKKALQIPTAEMKLTVRMMGYSRAASWAEMTVDTMVKMKDCLSDLNLVEMSAEETVRMMDCLSAASLAEKNMMAVNLAEKTMLDYLTADATAPKKEPSLDESLAVKMDEEMASSLVEMLVEAMVRLTDCS